MEKHQRPHRWALILLLAVLFSGDPLWATTIVVPGAWETTEGPSDNALPFSLGSSSSSARYQQVYDASAFSGLSGPQFVTAITFRRNGFSSVPFDFSEIIGLLAPVIHLSTTSASADGLSATFADNVGADDMVVKSGPFQLSSAPAPPGLPKPFDITIDLTTTPVTPFLYDPTAGNLLLDIFVPFGFVTTQFDAAIVPGDETSRVVFFDTNNDAVNSPTGFVDSGGLITQLTFTPVPEPSAALLVGLGLLAFAVRRRITRKD